MIGKAQHGNLTKSDLIRIQNGEKVYKSGHEFDVMQHSLKVMQKIAQDPKFKKLNESDQKIMLLASLLHDITKAEGKRDVTHAKESSFDTFFIGKKFNLSKDEEQKLYTLCKNHEWLRYVNTSKFKEGQTKRLQSVAYDLRQDNMFDMAEIFTHADLRAVKKDDSFHDKTEGESRTTLNGTQRSFGESANVYAEQIREMIGELKKSQPILPTTRIPQSSTIKDNLIVNDDGITNIKGVYVNKDGLVIIKYNEVEDWEAIGFDKGSISQGIKAQGVDGKGRTSDVETGNIKFIAHGLDFPNQLANFDAFGLIDSDALLSVSYMERPESKYRLFRTQGVLLDVDTKNIHAGGNTDSGSGCKKPVDEIKKNYIFGGKREEDRVYLSNLVKKATGMTDEEYIKFVAENENKPFSEIEPAEIREAIIKEYASINSNERKGERAYNEMYINNPKRVSAVFSYSEDNKVGDALKFVESRADKHKFLQKYALEHDIPMMVFGD